MTGIVLHHDALSRPLVSPQLRVLSLGAGVQSTTLALMAANGELDSVPDYAVFADTGDEPKAVYRHLDWLEGKLPFPVRRAQRRSSSMSAALMEGDESARIPAFIGGGGMKTRQCTRDWKIRVIRREIRALLGASARTRLPPSVVESWIGISTDEIERLTPSGCTFVHNRHPLVEARMSRHDCERWLTERQYPIPPKSACRYCPYTDNARWRDMRDNAPEDFAGACEIDEWFRQSTQVARFRGQLFIHRSRRPLALADLEAPDEGPFGFENECEGMCGV
jgi:hypothetical protein